MNILLGFTDKQGQFEVKKDTGIMKDYHTLTASYASDEDPSTVGWRCHTIKIAADVIVRGAPDLVACLYCPVEFVVDPNSIGMTSDGKPKAPVVAKVILDGDPTPIVPPGYKVVADPGSSLGATEDQNKKPEKGGTK